MKRGKDEEIKEPMFPRLHVNDREKRGPRGPPRNKMALYEQFSIPSQRFNNKAANLEQQFNIPPQRFNHSAANLEPPSNQGVANEHDMLLSCQQGPTRHQSEKPYGQYSDFSIPLTQRKKSDEEDFRVPIFVQSQECGKYANNLNRASDPCSVRQEVNSKEFATNHQLHCEPRDTNSGDSIDILDVDEEESIVVVDKINSPAPRASNSEVGAGNQDKSSFRSVHDNSVSETSVVDSISTRLDITTDEMVEMIGQNRFWKARKAILNQQRVFAVQVFELHRLVKVQRLIAEAPQILADQSPSLDKPPPTKLPLPRARIPKQNAPIRWPLPPVSRPWCLPQGQQWLIPVMSPSEGLVYKPYPAPAFGPPAPPPAPYYPPAEPHAYCGHPISASSLEQNPSHNDDTEQTRVLPLFPTCPDTTSSPPECPVQAIKVVPHNATSATESAARIFQSIQQERRHYESM